jgi:hypothetical protein
LHFLLETCLLGSSSLDLMLMLSLIEALDLSRITTEDDSLYLIVIIP